MSEPDVSIVDFNGSLSYFVNGQRVSAVEWFSMQRETLMLEKLTAIEQHLAKIADALSNK